MRKNQQRNLPLLGRAELEARELRPGAERVEPALVAGDADRQLHRLAGRLALRPAAARRREQEQERRRHDEQDDGGGHAARRGPRGGVGTSRRAPVLLAAAHCPATDPIADAGD